MKASKYSDSPRVSSYDPGKPRFQLRQTALERLRPTHSLSPPTSPVILSSNKYLLRIFLYLASGDKLQDSPSFCPRPMTHSQRFPLVSMSPPSGKAPSLTCRNIQVLLHSAETVGPLLFTDPSFSAFNASLFDLLVTLLGSQGGDVYRLVTILCHPGLPFSAKE